MKNTDLTNTYRELDRELAILHDQLESHRSFENILFLPTPEKIRSVREKWNDLKHRSKTWMHRTMSIVW